MKRLFAAWSAFCGASLLVPGCKAEPPEPQPIPVESFAAEFSTAVCGNASRCCSASYFTFDQPDCEGRLKASFQASLDQALLGSLEYDEVAAGKCLAALVEQSCGVASFRLPSCKGLFQGKLESGAPCKRDSACKSRWCAQLADASEAVCQPIHVHGLWIAGKHGDPCVDTCEAPEDCPSSGGTPLAMCYRSDGLYCGSRANLAVPRCEPLREVGQPCEYSHGCVAGLFCQGICQVPHPNGVPCEFDAECRSGACLDGECAESALTEEACVSGGRTF